METIQNKTTVPATGLNQKSIEGYKETASHLEAAAKHHLDAARHHEAGSHEKAGHSTLLAQGYMSLAYKAQGENAKRQALASGS